MQFITCLFSVRYIDGKQEHKEITAQSTKAAYIKLLEQIEVNQVSAIQLLDKDNFIVSGS